MFLNISFYKFFEIQKKQLKDFKLKLNQRAEELKIKGLALISQEGLNGSFCGQTKSIAVFKPFIENLFRQDFFWKDSLSERQSFKRLSIKIKKEIINSGERHKALQINSLSPQKWEQKLKQKPQVLDVRNNYETALGRFESAQKLDIKNFQEFPKKLGQSQRLDKNKETLIYCTGGVRCEKALSIMKEQGFNKIYQLDGGILNYLKYFPRSQFKQDCFVFDHRVALDQNLKASNKYALCPHCGQPGDLKISCRFCFAPAGICRSCNEKAAEKQTCSKNCAYHFKSGHICRKKYKKPALVKPLNP